MLSVATDNEWAETLIALAGNNASNAARHFGKDSYDRGMVAQTIVWSRIADAIEQRLCQFHKRAAPVPARVAKSVSSATYDSVLLADLDFASLEMADQPQAVISVKDKARASVTPAPPRRHGVYRLSRSATQSLSGIAAARRVAFELRKRRKREAIEKVASTKRKLRFDAKRKNVAGKILEEKGKSSKRRFGIGLAVVHRKKQVTSGVQKRNKRPLVPRTERAHNGLPRPLRRLSLVANNHIRPEPIRFGRYSEARNCWIDRRAA